MAYGSMRMSGTSNPGIGGSGWLLSVPLACVTALFAMTATASPDGSRSPMPCSGVPRAASSAHPLPLRVPLWSILALAPMGFLLGIGYASLEDSRLRQPRD